MTIRADSVPAGDAVGRPLSDYMRELLRHRAAWERKPAVRAAYRLWHEAIAAELTPPGPVVELGCGCGALKEHLPDIRATDAFETPWAEQVVDACAMPFQDGAIGNLVMVDVLHHLPAPMLALLEAERVLVSGGRLVLLEPYISAWSRLVYGLFHHEPFDMRADLATVPAQIPAWDAEYANAATATLLFGGDWDRVRLAVPRLRLVRRRPLSIVVYALTGGFGRFALMPACWVAPLSRLEDRLPERLAASLALRLLITLEKT